MKQDSRRVLSWLLALGLLFGLFSDWLPASSAADTDTPRLSDGGIVLDNNGYPWGSDMTLMAGSFTLNIRTKSDPSGNTYQWQYSDDKEAWTNEAGETEAQYHVTAPVSGRWYRCVVTNGGQSAASKPLEAVFPSDTGDIHGRIWTFNLMSWFLSNGHMAYRCDLHSPGIGNGGKFFVFGEYHNPANGKDYMLQTSYAVGGWRIYSVTDANPEPVIYGRINETQHHLDEILFTFRDEYPHKIYVGPDMEAGYRSICVLTDAQLGSKASVGDYSDTAALQTVLRADHSPLQISMVAAQSLSAIRDDTASMAVNLEEIDASTNFKFCLGRFRDANAFTFGELTSPKSGYSANTIVSNGNTYENVITVVEGVDSGFAMSWMNQSDSAPIWFSIGTGSVKEAEIIEELEQTEPQQGLSPWKSLQAAIDAGISKIQLVKPGETQKSGYTAVYTNENGVVPAESDDRYLHVAAGKNITIDLNGMTIDRKLSVRTPDGNAVKVEGSLTLEDSAGGGYIRGGYNDASEATGGGVLVSDGGAFTMNGGAIAANRAYYGGGVYVEDGGTFTMNGGTVSGNDAAYGGGVANNGTFDFSGGAVRNNNAIFGGGVFNNESGVTTMSGGEISGNNADGDGGGVANYNRFTMSGGAITGNAATNGGGVVNADMGDDNAFTVTGGSITGNEAEDYGGGVMLYDGLFALSGSPDISGNAAGEAGQGFYLSEDAVITVSGALSVTTPIGVATEATPTAATPVLITDELRGNGASSDFTSENPDYEVQLNSDGEAVLALPSPELTQAPAAKALTYNGAAQELITAGTASKGTLLYRLGDSGSYSATIPVATNAGAYTVYYKVAGENGAPDTPEQSLAVTIAPKPLTSSMVTLSSASKVYNGETQTPGVAVTDGSTALSAGTDYTVSGDTGTDVDTYTAVVTGIGNYTGTVEKSWAITPAAIAPKVTLAGWTYGDAANSPTVDGNAGNGAALIGYKPKGADNEAYSSVAPTDAGNYVVRVQVAATKNYLAGEAEANFTIQKRPATVTASDQSVLKGEAIEQGVSRAGLSGNVSGHTLSAVTLTSSSTAAPTDSGTITPSAAKIVRGGTDVTANYDISYVDGRLTVDMPSFPVTFYSDSAGTTVDQKHDVLSGSSLSGYASLTLENSALRTFAGWSLEKGVTEYYGNESKIIDWAAFVMPEAPVSVYPVWVENQLTILLDLNAVDEHNKESWYDAAKFDAASPASMDAAQARQLWMKIGDKLDMSHMNTATRPGYILGGWRTRGGMLWDASWKIDPEYCDRDENGAPILQYASDYRGWYYTITLTAQWTPEPKKSSVMYDLNGGTGDIVDNATYVVNDLLTVTSKTPTPPDGKLFAGWLDKAGNLYQPGDTGIYESEDWLSVQNGEEALWMTAYYEDIPEPDYSTITFKTGGGTKVSSITLQPGEAVTPPDNPTRTGYTFAGWSPEVPATMPDEDLTITAQWTPNRYTITFDTGRGTAVTPITQDFGTPVTPPASPVLTGYTFAGWDSEFPATMPAHDMTLSAVWTINSYTLTFDTDGGSELPPRTGIYGASVVLPAPPVKDGYIFNGWDKEIPATVPAVHMTVKALWLKQLDVSATDYNGVYDGQSHGITVNAPEGASVTYSDTETGVYSATNPTYKDAGEYTVYYTVTADGAETVTGSAKVSIAKKEITVTGIKALNKDYDGNTSATLDYSGVTLNGLVTGDTLRVSAHGVFADAEPGTGKTVAVSGLTLDGDSVNNYRLADAGQQSATTADIIAPAPELSTTIYAVKQAADGTWTLDNASPLETSDSAAYTITELYKDGHFHVTAYSVGAYADESGRVAVSAGQNIPLDSANGKLYLYFARDAFDLTFYADTNGTKVLKTEKVLYGASLSDYAGFTLPDTELATFAGWSTEKGVTVYNDGKGNTAPEINFNSLTMSAAPLDVYPMFITNYINVRLNLGADDAIMDASQGRSFWKAADAGILVDMSRMNAVTRPDYTLDGWYTKDGTRWDSAYAISKEYCDRGDNGNVVTNYDEPYRNHTYTLTLTAKWKLDLNATVDYDLNGGSGTVTDSTVYPFNSFVTVSETAPTPPEHQIFVGWLDSTGTLHNPGDSFPFANKALRTVKNGQNIIALTAQYVTPKDVMITFDTDGGTAIAPITEDAGEMISAPDNPVKTGYTFTGWDKQFPAVMPTSNLTLKAQWKVNAYTLTFDTGRGSPVAPLTLDYGAAVNVSDPSLTGYDFAGWEPELPSTMPPQNLTLTAQWTPHSYTLTFDTDGGSPVESVTDIYGAWISAPENPTKAGYVFQDWTPELPATIPAESITVKAIWKLAEHTITFDTDGGTEIAPISGVPGSPVTAPTNPTKAGYVFQGWKPELPATISAESITVKAIWKLSENTIVFDTDGGTEIAPISGVPGSPVTAPANPTKAGYVFQGWTPTLPATIPAESITVQAIWKQAEHTIIFDTDGGTEIAPISGVPGSPVTPPDNPTKAGYVFQGWTPELPATIPAESITVTAQWTPLPSTLDVSATDYSGVYDGKSHSVSVTAPAGAVVTYSDTESGTYSATNPACKDAGEYTVYYKVTADGANTVTGSAKVSITRKDITVSGIKALNKAYDGNTSATLDYSGVTLKGLVTGDTLTVTASGAFADAEPGTGKTVVISGLTLNGDSTNNYRLADTGQQTRTTADIIAPAPGLSTNIYAVKQAADGTWTLDSAAPLETSDKAVYQVTELYQDAHFHVTAYSVGAYADESGRIDISAGQNVALNDADGKLYLYFARDAFDLTFYANTAGTKVRKTVNTLYGASLSEYAGFTLKDTEIATFAGWSLDKGVTVYNDGKGNTAQEIDFNSLTMPAAPLDVYPMFITNYINVRLDLGADDAIMDASQGRSFWKAADAGILVDMTRMNAATRPDYALDGWYTKDGARWDSAYAISREHCDRDADGNVVENYDAPYRNHTYTLTLVAKWKIDISATVWYDLNGGTGDIADDTAYPFNSYVTVSETTPTPPENQIFVGWLDSAGTLHNPGDSFPFANKALRTVRDGKNVITLTAQYITPKDVMITFDTDGGTAIAPITADAGEAVTPPDNPVKTGCTFTGWDKPFPSNMPDSDLTLKAQWKVNLYTLTFDTGRGTPIDPLTLEYGAAVNVSNPSLTGYDFAGWEPGLPETMPPQDLTLTAQWTPRSYTLTFDTDGGSPVEPVTDIYGAWISVPDDPVKDGYVFQGWDTEIPASMPAENMTFTAHWAPLSSELHVTAESYDGMYDGQSHSITVAVPDGAAVAYSESKGGDYGTKNPAYRDAGQYRVYYRVTMDGAETVNGSSTVHISRKEVTVSGITARNKPYDGNTTAILVYSGVTFAGLLSGDTLTVTASGAFTDPEPGDGKTVLISGLTLGGDSVKNYRLAAAGQQSATTADITAKTPENLYGANVYAVRQNADGTWENNAVPLESLVTGASSYRTAEQYAAEHFRMVSYSLGAYADESARTAASAGDTVPLSGDNRDLYLYYARETFELVFYSDSDGKTVSKTYRVPYGAALSGYAGETLPQRADYTFAGWASAPNQTSYANKNGVVNETVIDWDAETMPAETKHVYPVWVHDRLNVRLDLGGYDADNNNPWYDANAYDASTPAFMDAEQIRDFDVDIGELMRMSAMNAATRVGYELDGWYTQDGVKWNPEWGLDPEYCTKDANGNYDKYENETRRYSVYAVILTARWKPIEIGVVYDTNGGTGTITDSASYKLGDTLPIADAPTPPGGKTFVGWKDKNDVLHSPGESLHFTDWSIVGSVSGADAIPLTADYIDTPKNDTSKHVITFDTDGGTAIAPLVLDTGATVTPPKDPTKTGYKFAGWSPELPATMPDTDLTVKARWNADKYTITFVTHTATEIAPITDAYGANVTKPADPLRENYVFRGWTPELPETMPAQNLTVEAVWEPKTYTITFDTDGGNTIDPITGIYGSRVTPPENPVKKGYTFNGWKPQIPDYMPSANLTVTAQWVSSTGSGGTPSTGGETTTTPTTPSTPSTGGGGGGGSSGGGGGTTKTYKVTVVKVSDGKAKASPTRAADGVKITVTVSPDKSYTLETITVKADKTGADVAVSKGADGSCTFVMPKSDVTVTPAFVKLSSGSTPSGQDSETSGGTPETPSGTDGSIVPDDGDTDGSTVPGPGDTDGSSGGEPVPVPPDKTGVSDWLLTDAHPSYINGFKDGTFRPNASITRAQTAMMFYRLLKNKNVPKTVTYRDMNGKEWYAEAVYTLSYYGIIQGYSDGNFHGDRTITRAAFTAIAARFAKHLGDYKDGALRFSDVPETHWARDVITGAASCGWIAGYDDGTFRPANSITRAAATAIINRMLARTADKEYVKEHFGDLKPFSDVRDEPAWYFYNVMEAANNHDFTVTDNQEVWNSVKN